MAARIARVEGAANLRRTLRAAGRDLNDLKGAHRQAAEYVAARSRSRAPVVTGRLAGTVRASCTTTRAIVRAGFARVPYANPIHWGWPKRNITAQPFIVDTAVETEPAWVRIYTREVDKITAQVKGI